MLDAAATKVNAEGVGANAPSAIGDSLECHDGPQEAHHASPIRVAVIDSHELVVTGATTLLSRYPERVELLEWSDSSEVDVVLYGVDEETVVGHDAELHALRRSTSATVLAFGWNPKSLSGLLAAACGLHGFVDKRLPAAELVTRVELLHRARSCGQHALPGDGECHHPGVETSGLSKREIEVLSLVASGYCNREIADELFLSINSIKTYVRSAYRKIRVNRRAQAVIWARCHGLGTDGSLRRGPATEGVQSMIVPVNPRSGAAGRGQRPPSRLERR